MPGTLSGRVGSLEMCCSGGRIVGPETPSWLIGIRLFLGLAFVETAVLPRKGPLSRNTTNMSKVMLDIIMVSASNLAGLIVGDYV